ncbi:hypothetical protein GN156_12955 [bacterium LRH843]|nr:hypothetical protein [bacterium LRH843]
MGKMIFIILIAIIIVISFAKLRKKKKLQLKYEKVPSQLGFLNPIGKPIASHLELSLLRNFQKDVKGRMLQSHSKWNENDFSWRLFELKRYFVLNSMLKTVPMFSSEVDEVWHEMLMFTKEYESFSQKFFKGFLHHTPNLDATPIPGERAFFDWMYLSLFKPKFNSRLLWGGFLSDPIKKEILDDFNHLSEEELLERYFRQNGDWMETKRYLIQKMKKEISQARDFEKENKTFRKVTSENEYHKLLPAAVFFSLYEPDLYQHNMNELLPYYSAKSAGGSSSCSGYGCSSSSSNNDSGGSSSCSSCGGGD